MPLNAGNLEGSSVKISETSNVILVPSINWS